MQRTNENPYFCWTEEVNQLYSVIQVGCTEVLQYLLQNFIWSALCLLVSVPRLSQFAVQSWLLETGVFFSVHPPPCCGFGHMVWPCDLLSFHCFTVIIELIFIG